MATLTLLKHHEWTILRISGEIQTLADFGTLKQVLQEQVRSGGTRIALDLAEVRYISSGGIGVLALVQQQLSERGSALVLIRPRREVRHLLEVMSLDTLMIIVESFDDLALVALPPRNPESPG